MGGPALIIPLVAAGISAVGGGLKIGGSIKPYFNKEQWSYDPGTWGDYMTAGTVSGVGAGHTDENSVYRYQVENKTATNLRLAGGFLLGIGGALSSVGSAVGQNAASKAKRGLMIDDSIFDRLDLRMTPKQIQDIKYIKGPKHEKGGVDMTINNKAVEAEGDEYLLSFDDGSKAVFNKDQMKRLKGGVPLQEILMELQTI